MDGGACLYFPEGSRSVRSYCFPISKGKTYTVSMYVKAPKGKDSGNVSFLVINPDYKIGIWQKGNAGKDWKQLSWTFTWNQPDSQKKAYIDVGSGSGVLVDRIQVTSDKNPTYEAPVMMALVGDRYPYFIRGRDAAEMKIRVAPGTLFQGKAKVKAVARDAWGEPVWTRDLDVDLAKITDFPISLPTDKLGNFHVSFEATQDGKVIGSGYSRYAIMDQPAKMQTSTGQPSYFGVCQSLFAWSPWANEIYAQVIKDTGPQFNRFFAKAPKDLKYPWSKEFIETQIALVKSQAEAGIDLMGCIQFFPGSFQCGDKSDMPTQEELDSYGAMVKEYVKALSPYIKYWEIFNEPDLWRSKKDGKRAFSPAKYLAVQKVAYNAIKSVDPKLVVVCNALNTMRWKWMEEWFSAGGCKYMDFFSFHPYRSHPDQLNEIGVYADLIAAREMLNKYGGEKVGMINSEQLYGCNLFSDRKITDEVRRGYYLDGNHELEAATRQVRNLIHHVAAGVTCCPFTFRDEFAFLGPGNSLFVYDMIPAYNATTRFLAEAGRGKPLDMGDSLRVFVFPDAKEGPLAAVWTPVSDAKAVMKLKGDYKVFDIMGNRRPEMETAHTLKFSTDPVWLRYGKTETFDSIKESFAAAEVRGVGDPVKIDVAISGEKELTVYVTSLTNQPINGSVWLQQIPEGWNAAERTQTFGPLEGGGTAKVKSAFTDMALSGGSGFEVLATLETNAGQFDRKQTLRPFICNAGADKIRADGDVSDWKGIPLTTLDENYLSKNFDPSQRRSGDDDLSAKVGLAWSKEKLAFIAIVRDDRNFCTFKPDEAYKNDSIQIYIDQLNNATEAARNSGDDISYTLTMDGGHPAAWISKGAEGNFKGDANKCEGLADPEAQLAIKRSGNTTVYELILPRAACLPNVKLDAGGGFGFSLLINDNDGKGRKVGLTLSPKGKEPYGAPQEYRDVVLSDH
ncbi:MAG: carbohydrate binding domain-containing protein [Planctomycetes bacterium]|nr:carbohydrate binding domain-containing protein [Planctomycetota bacterium]